MYTSEMGDPRDQLSAAERRAADAERRAGDAEHRLDRARVGESALRAILEYLPEGIAVADLPDMKIRMLSRHTSTIIGCPLEAMEGRSIPELIGRWGVFHPDAVTPLALEETPSQRAARGEAVANAEMVLRRPDGRKIHLSVNAGPLRDAGDTITGVVVSWCDITSRRQIEQQIRESESRYRLIVENQTEFIVRSLPDGTRTFVNESYCRYFGTTREEAVGTSFYDFVAPEERERVHCKLASLTPERPMATDEHLSLGPGGALCWTQWVDKGTFDAQGHLVEVQSVGRDITDLKRVEDALRASEANYRAIFSAANDAIMVHDIRTGVVIDVNQRTTEMYGYTAEEFRSLQVDDFSAGVPPYTCEDVLDRFQRAAAGEPQLFEWLAKDRAGRLFWAEVNLKRALISGEERILAVVRDISERKAAEEALRRSEERYRKLVETSPDGIILSDTEFCILSANRRAAEMGGYATPQEMVGRNSLELLAPEERERVPRLLNELMRSGRIGSAEFRLRRQDGRCFPVEVSASVIHDADGRPEALLGIVRDITERRQKEEELAHAMAQVQAAHTEAQQANTAKDQFLAVLSHELRNPLAPILAGVDVLRRSMPRNEVTDRTLSAVERGVKMEARLVDDLLDLSRIARGKIQLRRAPITLDTVVEAAVQAQQAQAEEAGLSLRANTAPNLWVMGDFDRLHQMVTNLLTNAIKFTPSGGEIRVLCEPRNAHRARIVVEDTGVGITREVLPRLFTIFQQGGTAERRRPGLGIGLALVKSFAEVHGGQVRAESEGPGKGSRFTVEMPLIAAPASVRSVTQAVDETARLRVLLVEDSDDARAVLSDGLDLMGWEVRAAASAEEALELLSTDGEAGESGRVGEWENGRMEEPESREQECPSPPPPLSHSPIPSFPHSPTPPPWIPNVILSDIGLPGMDGYDFIRRVHQMPGLADVPAFALTGYGADEDVHRAGEAGYVSHFIKPVDLADLDHRIREWLGAHGRG